MPIKQFAHHSTTDFALDRSRVYDQRVDLKPAGLWCSEFGESDRSDNWSDLCVDYWDGATLDARFAVEVDFANVLICENPASLRPWFVENHPDFGDGYVDWRRVADVYSGVHFKNYCRMPDGDHLPGTLTWWSTVDISSLCVWDLGAVVSVRSDDLLIAEHV